MSDKKQTLEECGKDAWEAFRTYLKLRPHGTANPSIARKYAHYQPLDGESAKVVRIFHHQGYFTLYYRYVARGDFWKLVRMETWWREWDGQVVYEQPETTTSTTLLVEGLVRVAG